MSISMSAASFRSYLQRLHNLAGERPLLIGEFGINVLAEGEEAQADILSWHIEEVVRSGRFRQSLLFCWTDEWFTGGHEIQDWAFGLVDRERRPRPVCQRLPITDTQSRANRHHDRYPLVRDRRKSP
jgi:hypothetical protein